MKILFKFLTLFFVLFSFFTEAWAQQNTERSKVVETISGKKYYKHTIEKGQTLYSISKLYAIDQKIIEQENPELKEGFKIGQTLKIPFDKESSEATVPVVQDNKNNYVKHIVEKEQTLYSISKKYNVSIDDIKKLNPDAVNGIRLGQELTIPVLQTTPSVIATKTQTTVTPENTNAKTQSIVTSKEIVRIEGKDYLLHKVESGQTIYSIAKAYNVSKEELMNNNPQLIDGLQLGQVLKIESKATATVTTPKTNEKETDSYFLHKVEKGQTVNAIAVKYGCTTDDIFALNPDIVNGLKENAFIKVPKKKAGSVTFSIPQTSLYVKKRETPETINIGLFLPFYIAKNDSGKVYKTTANDETIYPKSIPAVEFYQGFLMAMDSINRTGLKVKLFVYDFPSEPAAINKFLEKEELKNMDAIVGPFHSDDVTPAALFAKKNNIYLFAPLSQQSKSLLGNPFLVKITPSTPTIVEQTAEYIAKHYAGENIFIVHNSMPKEKNAIEIFKTRLNERIKLDTLNEGIYKNEGIKGTYALMKKDKKNVIFFPSTDQAIVTDLINKLNTDKKNDIVLFGMDNWINYENLDIELMQNIHLHIPSIGNVNYLSDTVKNFIGKFRAINKNEPSRFAYSGYDSGILMMNLFSKKDTAVTNEIQGNSIYYLQNKLNNFTSEGLFSKFFFYQTSMDSGFENQGVYILRYEDYTLKNAE